MAVYLYLRQKTKKAGLGCISWRDFRSSKTRTAEEARENIAKGIDPGQIRSDKRKAKQLAMLNKDRIHEGLPILNSFEDIARQWLASTAHTVSELTHNKKIRRFEVHAFPVIGNMDISAIKSPDIFSLVKPLFNQLETSHRIHAEISAAFCYATAHGFTDYNPSQAVSKQIPAKKVKNRAALTEPKDVGRLLRDISGYQGTFTVQCAFRLSPLLFQRPGEIRQMEWKDIDLEAKEWRYFVTKTEVDHIIPLSTQM
jgi:integrase